MNAFNINIMYIIMFIIIEGELLKNVFSKKIIFYFQNYF